MWEKPPFTSLEESLADPSNPIGMRMRAAYYLRQEHSEVDKNEVGDVKDKRQQAVVDVLGKGLLDERHGSLMRHEIAYVMGQCRDEKSCPTLEEVLANENDCVMVRHEAAEALGAIGAKRSEIVLKQVMEATQENLQELAETCRLALDVMEWRNNGSNINEMPAACACMLNPYSSVDPAPPHPLHANMAFEELGDILCDGNLPIFERYRAMFSLRNRGGADAVKQLCRALTTDTTSALLRHEVAYVLGQMQHPDSVEALEESLRRPDEHSMVRHESAEALGAIDGRWEDVERVLMEFSKDENDVVRESCLVALDAADYWGHSNTNGEDIEGKKDDGTLTFANQKADQRVLVNHFNVKQ